MHTNDLNVNMISLMMLNSLDGKCASLLRHEHSGSL